MYTAALEKRYIGQRNRCKDNKICFALLNSCEQRRKLHVKLTPRLRWAEILVQTLGKSPAVKWSGLSWVHIIFNSRLIYALNLWVPKSKNRRQLHLFIFSSPWVPTISIWRCARPVAIDSVMWIMPLVSTVLLFR